MKLADFEQQVDRTILQRGMHYYQSGAIDSLEEMTSGLWHAEVSGTDDYLVRVQMNGDVISSSSCSCPYDWGAVCKHEVAVYYELRDELEKHQGTTAGRGIKRRKTVQEQVRDILDHLSEKEAKAYLEERLLADSSLRERFLIRFSHFLGQTTDPEKYKKVVDKLIQSYSYRGYIEYRDVSELMGLLHELLIQAEKIVQQNPQESLLVAQAVYEVLPELAESMDDSDGETSMLAADASEVLQLYLEQVSDAERETFFEWLKKILLDDRYSDYGYDDVLNDLFNEFVEENPEYGERFRQERLAMLDTLIAKSSGYRHEFLLREKVGLLSDSGIEEEKKAADALIRKNVHYSFFREMLVKESLQQKDYKGATTLLLKGIKLAERKGQWGDVKKWREYLLEVAQSTAQSEEIIRLTKELFLSSHHELKYYRILKAHVPDWPAVYEELLLALHDNPTALATIFYEEKQYEDLLALIQQVTEEKVKSVYYGTSSDLYLVHYYKDALAQRYPAELFDLYQKVVNKIAQGTGRRIYQEVVSELKEMCKLKGGRRRAESMVASFRVRYKNRPAMQEILNAHFPAE